MNKFDIWFALLIEDYSETILIALNKLSDYKISKPKINSRLLHCLVEHPNKVISDVVSDIADIIDNNKLFIHCLIILDNNDQSIYTAGSNLPAFEQNVISNSTSHKKMTVDQLLKEAQAMCGK